MDPQKASKSQHHLWIFGVFVWALFSMLSTGYDSPDEHFPTLEAAGGILFGYWYPTWEWSAGLRSWIQPLIEAAWLTPFVKLGFTNRILLDSVLRILNSLLWLAGSLAATRTSKNLGNSHDTSQLVGLSTLLTFPFVVWGTHHGSDLFCIPFLLLSLMFLTEPQKSAFSLIFYGVFSALTFQIRFTTGPLILTTALSYFAFHPESRSLKNFGQMIGGFLPAFFGLNFLDYSFYQFWSGSPQYPIYEFFKFNVLEGSKQFHRSPFWEPILYTSAFLLPSWIFLRKSFFNKRERWLLAPILTMLALWMSIRHFEFRFLMPTLALIQLMIAKNKRGVFLNLALLAFALLLYRDPHGSQVQALSLLDSNPVVFVDSTGGAPTFYSKNPIVFKNLNAEEWKQLCQKNTASLSEQKPQKWPTWNDRHIEPNENWSHFKVISTEKCPHSSICALQTELAESLGRKLRRLVSNISSPGFVYNCDL